MEDGFTILHMAYCIGQYDTLKNILDIDRRKLLYPKFSILDIRDDKDRTSLHSAYFRSWDHGKAILLIDAYKDLDKQRGMNGKLLQKLWDSLR